MSFNCQLLHLPPFETAKFRCSDHSTTINARRDDNDNINSSEYHICLYMYVFSDLCTNTYIHCTYLFFFIHANPQYAFSLCCPALCVLLMRMISFIRCALFRVFVCVGSFDQNERSHKKRDAHRCRRCFTEQQERQTLLVKSFWCAVRWASRRKSPKESNGRYKVKNLDKKWGKRGVGVVEREQLGAENPTNHKMNELFVFAMSGISRRLRRKIFIYVYHII